MSYCRWSSDDFQSDVYVYESDTGFITHVAGLRAVPVEPMPPDVVFPIKGSIPDAEREAAIMAWVERQRIVGEIHGRAPLVPIGLPHDGETFSDPTRRAVIRRLRALRALGYYVPDHAIALLEVELAEEPEDE